MPSGLKRVAEGIYQKKKGGAFYERVRVGERDTYRKLNVKTLTDAKRERDGHKLAHYQAEEGRPNVTSPYEPKAPAPAKATVTELCADILAQICLSTQEVERQRGIGCIVPLPNGGSFVAAARTRT